MPRREALYQGKCQVLCTEGFSFLSDTWIGNFSQATTAAKSVQILQMVVLMTRPYFGWQFPLPTNLMTLSQLVWQVLPTGIFVS